MRHCPRRAPGPLAGALLLLSGCGTMQAWHARSVLPGATEPDIIACMGVPAEKQYLGRDQSLLQWDYTQSGTDVDLEFGIYSLKLGRPGLCHAAIRFDRGIATSVHFTGSEVTPSDPDSICGTLVHDCLYHRENTRLPADFDDLAVFNNKPADTQAPAPGISNIPGPTTPGPNIPAPNISVPGRQTPGP